MDKKWTERIYDSMDSIEEQYKIIAEQLVMHLGTLVFKDNPACNAVSYTIIIECIDETEIHEYTTVIIDTQDCEQKINEMIDSIARYLESQYRLCSLPATFFSIYKNI